MKSWWLYVVRCGDGTLYTGITTDPKRRLVEHKAGTGARYLRGRAPLEMIAQCPAGDRSRASRLELGFKAQSKRQKEAWLHKKSGLARFCDQFDGEDG